MRRTSSFVRGLGGCWKMHLSILGIAGALSGPAFADPTIQLIDVPSPVAGHRLLGEAADDRLGLTGFPVGDVNGDGLGDFAISAHLNDTPGTDRGRCYVVFGRTTGAANIAPTTIAAGTGGFVINGDNDGDTSGLVTGVGDVNDDGLADLLVSARDANAPAGTDAGRCYVVFGKSSGAPVDLGNIVLGLGGFVINGEAAGDRAGSVGGGGDINGDGRADLIITVAGKDVPAVDAGRTYVVFGKTSTTAVQLTSIVAGTGGFAINGEVAGAQNSRTDCAGDVNGDGLADILVSSTFVASGAGRTYVILGKTSGSTVELSSLGASGYKINGETTDDFSGSGLTALGDVNGDGLGDIGISAPGSNQGGPDNLGRAYVVFGKTTTTDSSLTSITAGTGGFVINGPSDGFGVDMGAAGDVNGDGRADIMISHPITPASQGTIFVLYGKTSGTPINTTAIPPSSLGFMLEGTPGDVNMGTTMGGSEDFNGDGRPDLLIGAYRSTLTHSQQGRAYLVYNTATFPASATYTSWFDNPDPDRQGVGATDVGDDSTTLPGSRMWIDFNSGFGSGVGASSPATVVLTRNDSGVANFNPAFLANVSWQLSSPRTAPGTYRVTVRYTDAEIAGLTEGALTLYTAPSLAGPWTPAGSQVLNLVRNEASGDASTLPAAFVLSTQPPDAIAPTVSIELNGTTPTTNQIASWTITFSEQVNPSFSTADINTTGTLAGTSGIISLTDVDPTYGVLLYPTIFPVDGTLGFSIPAGSVSDMAGNVLAVTAVAPVVHIDDPSGPPSNGDVNQDGFVNVADVTLLADHVVNGTPLP